MSSPFVAGLPEREALAKKLTERWKEAVKMSLPNGSGHFDGLRDHPMAPKSTPARPVTTPVTTPLMEQVGPKAPPAAATPPLAGRVILVNGKKFFLAAGAEVTITGRDIEIEIRQKQKL